MAEAIQRVAQRLHLVAHRNLFAEVGAGGLDGLQRVVIDVGVNRGRLTPMTMSLRIGLAMLIQQFMSIVDFSSSAAPEISVTTVVLLENMVQAAERLARQAKCFEGQPMRCCDPWPGWRRACRSATARRVAALLSNHILDAGTSLSALSTRAADGRPLLLEPV